MDSGTFGIVDGTRRQMLTATGAAVASAAFATFLPGRAQAAADGDLETTAETYGALVAAAGLPVVTRRGDEWAKTGWGRAPDARQIAERVAHTMVDARARYGLSAADPWGSLARLNAALRSDPPAGASRMTLRQATGTALTMVLDPNGYVDSAALASGGFPERPGDPVPKLAWFPLG